MNIALAQIDQIKELCRNNKVKTLFAFGSITRDDFKDSSDVDFIVDFEEKDPFLYTDLYFNFKTKLEDLFNRQIDLLEERGIRNILFKQELENTKVKIYG